MSLKTDCQDAIYSYAPQQRQTNAALLGEHKEYVSVVLTLLRDHYHALVDAGETNWTVPEQITQTLNEMKPY